MFIKGQKVEEVRCWALRGDALASQSPVRGELAMRLGG